MPQEKAFIASSTEPRPLPDEGIPKNPDAKRDGRKRPPRHHLHYGFGYESALALSWSNSACVIVPESSMALACAIWSVGEALPATDFT